MDNLLRIAHLEDNLVVNVSVGSEGWFAENQSEFIKICPEDMGTGCTYDPESDTFIAPVH